MANWRAAIKFRDRSNFNGTVTLSFDGDLDVETTIALANQAASIVAGLSNAVYVGWKVYKTFQVDTSSSSEPTARLQETLLIFLSEDGNEFATIQIPAATNDYWSETGTYAGVLADNELLEGQGLIDAIEDWAQRVRWPDGSPYPSTFEVIARVE